MSANVSAATAERFAALFKGGDHARGVCEMPKVTTPGKKAKARQYTVAEAPSIEHYSAHLAGQKGLGVVPLNRAGLCTFAVIDIDIYDGNKLNLAALNRRCIELGLPLIICQSKSGGAHCYVFFANPAEAARARALLAKWAAGLGHAGVEIFPKQDQLGDGEVGNWINLPYYGAGETGRYAIDADGEKLTLADFLTLAETRRISIDEIEAIEPPAAETVVKAESVKEGNRNNMLMSLAGKWRADKLPDSAIEDALLKANDEMCDPPLPEREVKAIARSVLKYEAGDSLDKVFGQLTRRLTDPITWELVVYGKTVRLETNQLTSYRLLNNAVVEQAGCLVPLRTDKTWRAHLKKLLAEQRTEAAAVEESPSGMAWVLIQRHLANDRYQARTKDELLQGKPWGDDEAGRVYFRLDDLKRRLDHNRIFLTPKELGRIIREHGGRHTTMFLKGSTTGVWWVPVGEVEQARQIEDFDVPRLPAEDI